MCNTACINVMYRNKSNAEHIAWSTVQLISLVDSKTCKLSYMCILVEFGQNNGVNMSKTLEVNAKVNKTNLFNSQDAIFH